MKNRLVKIVLSFLIIILLLSGCKLSEQRDDYAQIPQPENVDNLDNTQADAETNPTDETQQSQQDIEETTGDLESSQPQQEQDEVISTAVQQPPAEGTSPEPDKSSVEQATSAPEPESGAEKEAQLKMNVQVGNSLFTATLEKNAATEAFVEMMEQAPVTIQMSDYAGFEKVGPLGVSLPVSNSQITTQPGDIVLYSGNQIVIFYGSNSWSYTRLGKIDDLTGWQQALGSGDVTVTFSIMS